MSYIGDWKDYFKNRDFVHQIGFYAPDWKHFALKHHELFGSGPFYYTTNTFGRLIYRGQEVDAGSLKFHAAYGAWGSHTVEVVQQEPLDTPTMFTDGNDLTCAGINHIHMFVEDLAEARHACEVLDIPVVTIGYAAAADEDDAEMDRINPVCCHNGQQNRRHQHDDGKGFHKHAEEQQEDNHKEPHQVHIVGEGQDPVGDFHRDPVRGEQVAESRCREDEYEHAARQPGRGLEGRHETFQRQFLMDEDTHEDGVENGHDGGFRRREDTGVDAAKDDHRGEDGPEAVAQGVDEGLHGPVQPFRFEVPAQEEVHDAEADGDEDARDDAGHEHF